MNNDSQSVLRALVQALRNDPFYRAITTDCTDEFARDRVLEQYFDYSLREGERLGRCVVDPAPAAAIWLLPLDALQAAQSKREKAAILAEVLGPRGRSNYQRILEFMEPRARAVVAEDAWYLSIVGVAPVAQGSGIGAKLLRITLAEADQLRVPCYLETYTDHNLKFYERLGFAVVASHAEPVTACDYFIMQRAVPS